MIISVVASLINLGVSIMLMRAAKRYNSITLEADARHLMTDVWTTSGVLIGIALVGITGFVRLDPLIALAVAVNILFTSYRLLVRSGRGLMNVALPVEETAKVKSMLDSYRTEGISYHSLRPRQAAARKFLVVHTYLFRVIGPSVRAIRLLKRSNSALLRPFRIPALRPILNQLKILFPRKILTLIADK